MGTVAPFFDSPMTKLTAHVFTNQHKGPCRNMEMNYMECLHAYGSKKGETKCQDYKDDLHECIHGYKRVLRYEVMLKEREKQHKEGLIDQKYLPSPNAIPFD